MSEGQWTIYWNEYSADTYLYGAEIIYHSKKHIEYINKLMPPGTVIKKWFSKTIYQMARIEPALPMIDGEGEYVIKSEMKSNGGGCYLRIAFFDRYDMEISSVIIRESEKIFKCPIQTYSYVLELINAGTDKIDFNYITIQEVADEEKRRLQKSK